MHKLRKIQKIRKKDIIENKQSKATFATRTDKLMIGLWATYPDMLDDIVNQIDKKKNKIN